MYDLKALRLEFKLKQAELADVIGCKQANISGMEKGMRDLDENQMEKLIERYGEAAVLKYKISNSPISNNVNKRIERIINDNFSGDIVKFCNKLNLNQAVVITVIERSKPPYDMIMSILEDEDIKVNMKWLLTGEGEPYQTEDDTNPQISYTAGVPYYNVDFIGGFDLVMNDQTINPEYLINFKKYNDATCWCNVTGHSMEPEINNGDMIALKEVVGWREYLPFGEVYGIVTDEHRTIKRVTASSKGDSFLRLIPTNKSEEYQPQDIPTRLIIAVYKVLGCNKRL